MVSAELAPLAKTGGLADAVAGLSAALAAKDHDVRVLIPDYTAPPSGRPGAAAIEGGASVSPAESTPVPVYLIASPAIGSGGAIYLGDERDAARFWAFSRAAVAAAAALGLTPDIVHCHDWHAALVPALAASRPPLASAGTVLTLHNIGFQGAFPRSVLPDDAAAFLASLDDEATGSRDWVNFLETGIRRASAVTTVSPTYAREIATPELGMGLDAVLRARGDDFVGILNGVDYRLWSPESDPFITPRFRRGDADGKRRVKRAVMTELGLADDAPLIGAVSRLFEQKGLDLLVDALPTLLERTRARFAVLGSGNPDLEAALSRAAKTWPERIAFRRGYDEGLAHRIIAGSDFLVVPSRYEPCGLTQLYALRYGTVPIVRKTGGLADTVTHYDPASGRGTGCVFEHADVTGLIWGVTTALEWYESPADWERLCRNAEGLDFSWQRQCEPYEALYRRVIERRRHRSPSA